MNSKHYDVIVIGTGSMGSSACYFLAERGLKVLGLEQFSIPNERASHTGQSRIIRKAYFEHTDYVPLLEIAYQNWKDLEKTAGEKVYYKTGLLYHGPKDHPVIGGVKNASRLFNIPLHSPGGQDFPQFNFQDAGENILEPDAGFLLPDRVIELYVEQAKKKTAVIRTGEKTLNWTKRGNGFAVITDKAEYGCKKLVITAGAWTGKLLPRLDPYLKTTRQLLIWMEAGEPEQYKPENFPCWMIAEENRKGVIYGFPYLGPKFGQPEGLKAAIHFPDQPCDPDQVNREITETEKQELFDVIRNYLPGLKEITAAKTCLYANSPDENFIIDFIPGSDKNVVFACGFSGHGFKFVSVVGEILADMVVKGETDLPIGFLKFDRFQ